MQFLGGNPLKKLSPFPIAIGIGALLLYHPYRKLFYKDYRCSAPIS